MSRERSKPERRLGRTPYLESLIDHLVQGGKAIGLPEDAIRMLAINAMSSDAKIGGKYGRTLAEAVDMCTTALEAAGLPTERQEVIRLLATPKLTEDAAKALSHKLPGKRK